MKLKEDFSLTPAIALFQQALIFLVSAEKFGISLYQKWGLIDD
ncbi:hypothetical protein [Nostoc sp. FACHB-110]|nr:hypothetical protein [Nostoc sp. FACHB-110]